MRLVKILRVSISLLIVLSAKSMANTWIDLDENENYTARHEMSFVQAGDHFYLFGGRENPTTLDTYNYTTNTWTTSATAPLEFNHFQAIEYQGLIWVIGAFLNNNFPNETPATHVYVYDPANDVWYQSHEIPEERRRGSAGLVVYQDKFYIVGGNTIGHNGGFVNWFDVYDPQTGSWTALADAPNPRDHFHATVSNGKLYAAGGRLSGGEGGTFAPLIAQVDVFDFENNSWSTLPSNSNLPTPRAGTATVTFQGNIIVMGGESNDQREAFNTVESLDPTTNSWTEIDSLNHARHGTQAIVSGNGIFITGGSPRRGGGRQHNMEAFNSPTPVGTANIAGELDISGNEVIINATTEISINHVSGNQGVLITNLKIVGNDASSFEIINNLTLPALVPVNGSNAIKVQPLTNTNGKNASIIVTYSNNQQLSIPIKFEQNNSDSDLDLLLMIPAIIQAAVNNKKLKSR